MVTKLNSKCSGPECKEQLLELDETMCFLVRFFEVAKYETTQKLE